MIKRNVMPGWGIPLPLEQRYALLLECGCSTTSGAYIKPGQTIRCPNHGGQKEVEVCEPLSQDQKDN
jgi:hypothetical protein